MPIRPIKSDDRDLVQELLVQTGAFQPHEVAVAMELIDIALTRPDQQDYNPYVLENEGTIVAYACFGKNPMTRYTYEVYWIATRAGHMRRGYGREIFAFVEEEIRRRGGRQLIVETSSQPRNQVSQMFYAKTGCHLAARLPDFYDEGDDMLVYMKLLCPSPQLAPNLKNSQ